MTALAVALALPIAPAGAKVSLRTAKVTKTITVPSISSTSTYFERSQWFSAACRSKERAISVGIIDSPRPLAGQSFGPAAVSQFVVGAPGRTKVQLQVLCARGAKVSTKRSAGKLIPGGGRASGTATATVRCGGGGTPLAAPLSAEYAPGTGSFTSRSDGKNSWMVRNTDIPSSFPLTTAPNYADVACLSKRSVRRVSAISGQAGDASGGGTVSLRCPSGTRALGWGVELAPFARFSSQSVGGGSTLAFVKRAELSGPSAEFTFAVPDGAVVSPGLTPRHTAHVTCGQLR